MAKEQVYSLRVLKADRARWQKAAANDGRKLAAFITKTMNDLCRRGGRK